MPIPTAKIQGWGRQFDFVHEPRFDGAQRSSEVG
jgi:hypothetical protein